MEAIRGDRIPLISDPAISDEPGLPEAPPLVADAEDQRRTRGPLAGWLGQISLGEHFAEAVAAGHAWAEDIMDRARQAPKAGASALQNHSRKAISNTARAFEKAGTFARGASEATIDYTLIGGVMLLAASEDALLGAGRAIGRGFDALAKYIDGPRRRPAREARYQPLPQPIYQPYRSPASYPAYPRSNEFPEWLAPLRTSLQQPPASPQPSIYSQPAPPSQRPAHSRLDPVAAAAASTTAQRVNAPKPATSLLNPSNHPLHEPFERTARLIANYRVVSVYDGTMHRHFYGPPNTVYAYVAALRRDHPQARVTADKPYQP